MSLATHVTDAGLTSHDRAPGLFHPGAEHLETLRDGTTVLIRTLRADDRQLETDFIRNLSPHSRRLRFLCDFKQPSDALIDQMMDIDHDRREALIAVVLVEGAPCEIGVARYCATVDGDACECAITVADAWQHHGLGTLLMRHLIDAAHSRGFRRMISIDAADNQAMRGLAFSLGFQRHLDPENPSQVIHSLDLQALPT